MTHRPPPIHVLAISESVARTFVTTDLNEHPRRLHYIHGPDVMRGKSSWVIHIHPTATARKDYVECMEIIRLRGFTTLTFNDEHARALHREQEHRAYWDIPPCSSTSSASPGTRKS